MLDDIAAFARPADLPQAPDLAVLCKPPATVPGLINELGRLDTRAAIVMTAGLSAAQKQAMLAAARPRVLRRAWPHPQRRYAALGHPGGPLHGHRRRPASAATLARRAR